jgi:hypothetical protein
VRSGSQATCFRRRRAPPQREAHYCSRGKRARKPLQRAKLGCPVVSGMSTGPPGPSWPPPPVHGTLLLFSSRSSTLGSPGFRPAALPKARYVSRRIVTIAVSPEQVSRCRQTCPWYSATSGSCRKSPFVDTGATLCSPGRRRSAEHLGALTGQSRRKSSPRAVGDRAPAVAGAGRLCARSRDARGTASSGPAPVRA